jgi:hypothetical protein
MYRTNNPEIQTNKTLFLNDDPVDDGDEDDEKYGELLGRIDGGDFQMSQASKDYIDAYQALSTNQWDCSAWLTYIEEVLF